jgi:hypothetical protein
MIADRHAERLDAILNGEASSLLHSVRNVVANVGDGPAMIRAIGRSVDFIRNQQ